MAPPRPHPTPDRSPGPVARRAPLRAAIGAGAVLAVLAAGRWARPDSGLGAEERAFRGVLARQAARFPAMQPQDVYKLVHQATMGPRHAGLDSAMAAQWMAREIASLGPGPDEPLVDTISADGRMVRVNLRPFLAAGGDRAALVRAFVRSAHEVEGSTPALRRHLGYAEQMAASRTLPVDRTALRAFVARMRAAGYPAVGHSDAYEAAYHPAYRVVLATLVP